MKGYVRAKDIDVLAEKAKGIQRGHYCGFEALKNLYTLKPGCTTYVYGSPYSGKTELWLEILMNLSTLHGMRHALWTPETGDTQQVMAELISKKTGKDFYSKATEREILDAQAWLDEYFILIDEDGQVFTVDEFYELVDKAEKELGKKIHTTTVDPWNEFNHSFLDYGGREDKYLEYWLGKIRLNARSTGRHNCIITHVRDQQKKEKNGLEFYPPASPRELAGGQAWFRKAEAMICVWRPPFVQDEYEKNEAIIMIHKAKPKGIGDTGECSLFYDKSTHRYYENYSGGKRYANKEVKEYTQEVFEDAPF